MASGINDFLELELLDHALGIASWTMPVNVYAHLYTTTLDDTDAGTEVSGGAYAGTLIAFATPAAAGSVSSSSDCTFTTATASWGTVTDMAIQDAAATTANSLFWGALAASKAVGNGDTFKFNSGDVTCTLT